MSKSRDQEEESGSDYTTVSSDPSDLQPQGSLFGNLKTRLRWVPSSKQMHLDVRQNLQNRRNLEFRYKCTLNTNTGSYQYIAQLQKNLHQNTPSLARLIAAEQGITLRGEKPIDPDRFLPAGLSSLLWRDWTASPGIRFSSHPATADSDSSSSSAGSSPKYFVSLRKQPQTPYVKVGDNNWTMRLQHGLLSFNYEI
eukprot:gene3975-4228_t